MKIGSLEARKAFAASPRFEATLRVELNPDGSTRFVPKGATATVVISYGGRGRFRTKIAAVEPPFRGATSPGSYQVFDGRTVATFDSKRDELYSSPAPDGFQPLDYFSWRGGYPNWERICLRIEGLPRSAHRRPHRAPHSVRRFQGGHLGAVDRPRDRAPSEDPRPGAR